MIKEQHKELQVGSVLKCISNEGYWSIGDIRRVTKLYEKGFELDGRYYNSFDEFRYGNYCLVNQELVNYFKMEYERSINADYKSEIIIEHQRKAYEWHKSLLS